MNKIRLLCIVGLVAAIAVGVVLDPSYFSLSPHALLIGAIGTGAAKQVIYKVESAWGTVPAAGSAQKLRTVTSDLHLEKDIYQSNERRSDYQIYDSRHGVRKISGAINGELSPGTYKDFIAAALRKAWVATAASTGLSITIAGSGPTYTVTRGAGSYLTDGYKAGDVVRLSAGSFNAANLSKNLLIVSLTATVLTVMPLNGVALVAEGPIASSTVTATGKRVWVPTTGHLDLSYSIEHYFADLVLSEVFSGCKVDQINISLPPTGIATIGLRFMGKDVTTAASAYFTSPTAELTTGLLAAVNGLLLVQGAAAGLLTALDLTIAGGMSAEPVVGQNTYADIAEGDVVVTGNATVLFQDATMRDFFINETDPVALSVVLSSGPSAAADFLGITLPRVKFNGAGLDDGKKSLKLTMPFQALYNSAGGAGTSSEQSTIVVQDSQA